MTTKKKIALAGGGVLAAALALVFLPQIHLSPSPEAALADPPLGPTLRVNNNGTLANANTKVLNLTSGCTATASGTTTNVACTGAGGSVTSVECSDDTLTCTPDPVVGTGTVAVNQANSFVWTALHTWTLDNITALLGAGGVLLQNTTAAISGTQQYSPIFSQSGQGFGTNLSATQPVIVRTQVVPVQATNALADYRWTIQSAGQASPGTARMHLTEVHPSSAFGNLPGRAVLSLTGATAQYIAGAGEIFIGTDGASPGYIDIQPNTITLYTANTSRVVVDSLSERPNTDIVMSMGDNNQRWLGVFTGAEVEISSSGTGQVGAATTGQILDGTSGLSSGVLCASGERLNCPGTCTAGEVLVWSGTNGVAQAGASANLTTIAGVATTTVTAATVTVCRRGRVLVDADAGITAGELVGTSGATAGNVDDGAPGSGAVVGRATEATGGTAADKVIVDVLLF